ncbi:MAG: hydrogenase iron-sulfur subunit [Gammaproteobacteria bacterium]|nr:MAG: hydrogenase iron-sulfur subunit [Gammaproteobacteria bacterium]
MALKRTMRLLFERAEYLFDGIFTPRWNPFLNLGALGWFYYWIVVVSGIYLYIFFDTGVTQAYASLEWLTHEQWYLGGVMRSLHRYASDAMVVMVLLHLAREFSMDRYHGPRWFAWFTGTPMLWLLFAAGITGYWMVWDTLAQYVALTTSEWLDTLPIFGESIARNFLSDKTLNGRFFTLMVFIHIAVPIILLFIMWIHIKRHAHPRVNPPRGLAFGTMAMMLALSFAKPAVSHPPADLTRVPAEVGLDWFYMAIYPLLDRFPGQMMWLVLFLLTLLLMALPWLPPGRRSPVAVVSLENCNGCGRCAADCPFSAVSMEPRSDGSAYTWEAVVDEAHCVSCGICAGACPTSMPHRRGSELVPGIDLPELTMAELRDRTEAAAATLAGDARVIVFGCRCGADLGSLQMPGVATVELICIGMLPPVFIDYVISRNLADGVFLTGCREGDCFYRLGIDWTEQRLARKRDPRLRSRVPLERIDRFWAGLAKGEELKRRIGDLQDRLRELGPYRRERRALTAQAEEADHAPTA